MTPNKVGPQMKDTLIEVFEQCVHRRGGASAMRFYGTDSWESVAWKDWWSSSERLAAALIVLGVNEGDRVAILSETRREWLIADVAIMMAGAISVPLYPSATVASTKHVLRDSAPRVAIVENPSQLDKIARTGDGAESLEHILLVDHEANFVTGDWDGRNRVSLAEVDWPDKIGVTNFETALADGRRSLSEDSMLVASRRGDLSPDDVATIVYTSGTEALPKGVTLTHRNLRAEAAAIDSLDLIDKDDVQLLFLPLAHIFARVLVVAAVVSGIETIIGRGPSYLLEDATQTHPTFFAAVPQIFERLQWSFEARARRQGGWRERVFEVAVTTERGGVFGLGHKVANSLVRRQIESTLGERLRFLVSGGAPLSRSTCEFFCSVGIPLIEGYGLTETTAVMSANHPDDLEPGTVGRPLPGVEVAIDEDGEILVRGATLSQGYWNREEPIVDADGWFATGDLGQFDRDGYLSITGRKKAMIVTSGGKNVAPEPVEGALRASPLVDDAYLHGDSRPYVVALIVPNVDVIRKIAEEEGVELPPVSAWDAEPFVRRLLGEVVERVNEPRARFEAVRRFAVTAQGFEESLGERTPTGKLRRDQIATRRSETLAALYAERHDTIGYRERDDR